MKIAVIGSGLIGVTSAYFLRLRGHEVTVIDRQEGPARETSFANGALLTPSMPEPWNSPGSWRVLLGSLGRSDAALQLRVGKLPALLGWGTQFLRNSSRSRFERNTLHNLRLALHSLRVLQALRQQSSIDYGASTCGTLRVFRDPTALEHAVASGNKLAGEGLPFRVLSAQEVASIEPALAPIANKLAGAIYYSVDELGDAYRFCVALAHEARGMGVEFCFGEEVSCLEMRSGRIAALRTERNRYVADRYVVAAGSYSRPLLRSVGLSVPVRPAKGYSVTLQPNLDQRVIKIPVVDDDWHAAVVPLGAAIRVAGTAEFAGFDRTLDPLRIGNLLRLVRDVLPELQFDRRDVNPWCGLRPMCADGVPIVGLTRIPNLLVNTGHGHLGWTMAAGSAKLLEELVCGDTPSVDPTPYAFARFVAVK